MRHPEQGRREQHHHRVESCRSPGQKQKSSNSTCVTPRSPCFIVYLTAESAFEISTYPLSPAHDEIHQIDDDGDRPAHDGHRYQGEYNTMSISDRAYVPFLILMKVKKSVRTEVPTLRITPE
ncbi:hypothetical protein PRIPAC_90323 [Pristionchus pacificus]|uniref:Uncharacterized protein n=1 Tax=Pristionchus pacificus TaxID=54126 RepID=A0A2A6CXJ3_PRIPA|nr:hypothetical protein PRIPAC_90323 [Pristionchus pacificus]|eukprot:PDM82806.1 hypothetical protein PRIPAC_37199 [Pristionchus pacificus]